MRDTEVMKPSPKKIQSKDGILAISWSDGHEGLHEARSLRLACRCAACVDEWTHEARLKPTDVAPDVRPKKIDISGNYALQILWSDGHSTGLYLYDYLRDLCECGSCSSKRSFSV